MDRKLADRIERHWHKPRLGQEARGWGAWLWMGCCLALLASTSWLGYQAWQAQREITGLRAELQKFSGDTRQFLRRQEHLLEKSTALVETPPIKSPALPALLPAPARPAAPPGTGPLRPKRPATYRPLAHRKTAQARPQPKRRVWPVKPKLQARTTAYRPSVPVTYSYDAHMDWVKKTLLEYRRPEKKGRDLPPL